MMLYRMSAMAGALTLAGVLAACGGGSSDSSDNSSSGAANSASSSSSASSQASSASSSQASSSSSSAASSQSSSAASSVAAGTLLPANGETAAYTDTSLQIAFDSAPTIGTTGYINVYKADGTLVDKLSMNAFSTGSWVVDATASTPALTSTLLSTNNSAAAYPLNNTEVDRLGGSVSTIQSSSVELYRWVFRPTISVSGNVATIKLHDGKLASGTSYYVTMDSGVLSGTINGTAFSGISSTSAWAFKTKSDPSSQSSVTVAASGTTADFRTVQGALDWLMQNCAGTSTNACNSSSVAKTITIADGTYNELMWVRGVNNLTISGATRDGTVVQAENFEQYNVGTGGSVTQTSLVGSSYLGASKSESGGVRAYLGGGRAVMLVESVDLLTLNQFTLQNTHVKSSSYNNQAETIYFNSASLTGGRLLATYMNFFSAQDTVQIKGWDWFYHCLIKGDVDFIWGVPYAAVFENSELRTAVDPTDATSGGHVIETRAAYGYPGFVVLNSSLTKESAVPDNATSLARQANSFPVATYCNTMLTTGSLVSANYGCNNVAYINTKMGTHIKTKGWLYTYTPAITTPTTTAGYRESGSMDLTGATLDVSGRDLTYASTSLDLSGLNTRAKAFAQWSGSTGWAPADVSCSSAACTTAK